MFPDAVPASPEDAVLGLNAVSDGRNVVLASAAVELAQALCDRGYNPDRRRPVRVSEGRRQPQVLHPRDPRMTALLGGESLEHALGEGA